MQAVFSRGHEPFEQGSVETMQIFQSVRYPKAGTQIEMELGIADGRKIHQNHAAVSLLQSDCGIDCCRGGSGTALGTEKCEDAGPPRPAAGAGAIGTEAR